MLLSEMFGVERGEKFMVDGMCGEYMVGLFCEKYEKLLTIDSFGDWIPAKDGLLCVVIGLAPSGIIHLPPLLTDEQREQLKALWTLGYKWLAKDENGDTYAYEKEPQDKLLTTWWYHETGDSYILCTKPTKCLDSLVSWDDAEPFNIAQALEIKR